MRSLLTPEAQIVLLTAGGPETDAAIRALLSREPSWELVARLADLERALPPLWRRLARLASADELEQDAARALRAMAQIWEFRLMRLEGLLDRLLDGLAEVGIDVLLLKGAGLALTRYARFDERPMADIDLLVRPEHAHEAWLLAQRLGWSWDISTYPKESYGVHHHLPPLEDEAGSGVRLELHTDLLSSNAPFRLTAEALWNQRAEHRVGERLIQTPSLEHQIVHTWMHFAWSHCLATKAWRTFRDIGIFCETDEVRWEGVLEVAREAGAETCGYWTMRLARDLCDLPVPAGLIDELQPRVPRVALDLLARHHAVGLLPDDRACPSVALEHLLWRASLLKGRAQPDLPTARSRSTDALPGALGWFERAARQVLDYRTWRDYGHAVLSRRD